MKKILLIIFLSAFHSFSDAVSTPIKNLNSELSDISSSDSLAADDPRNNISEKSYRLPNDTLPLSYEVQLSTNIHLEDEKNPEKFNFKGLVNIKIRILETTKVITIPV